MPAPRRIAEFYGPLGLIRASGFTCAGFAPGHRCPGAARRVGCLQAWELRRSRGRWRPAYRKAAVVGLFAFVVSRSASEERGLGDLEAGEGENGQ